MPIVYDKLKKFLNEIGQTVLYKNWSEIKNSLNSTCRNPCCFIIQATTKLIICKYSLYDDESNV